MARFEAADAEVTKLYQRMLAQVDCQAEMPSDARAGWKHEIARTQEAWKTYRDLSCSMQYRAYGDVSAGATIALMAWECLDAANQSRIRELRDLLHETQCR